MTEIELWLVDAFTDTPLAGNPTSIVPRPGEMDDETCCRISAEVGVSETAFVLPAEAEGADHRLRFYTPTQEVDLCGHATVGAFWSLAETGRIPLENGSNRLVQETNLGNLAVWIDVEDGAPTRVMMEQKLPRFKAPEVNLDKIAAVFGLGRKQLDEELPVEIVSTGIRSLHIPVNGLSGFPEMKILQRGVLDLSQSLDVSMVQLFTLEAERPDADAHCRVFAPAVGVQEDPVTGTAAGSLGAYVVRHGLRPEDKDGTTRIAIEQGSEVGRPGLMEVEIRRDEGEFTRVRVGGKAVITLTGRLKYAP